MDPEVLGEANKLMAGGEGKLASLPARPSSSSSIGETPHSPAAAAAFVKSSSSSGGAKGGKGGGGGGRKKK